MLLSVTVIRFFHNIYVWILHLGVYSICIQKILKHYTELFKTSTIYASRYIHRYYFTIVNYNYII